MMAKASVLLLLLLFLQEAWSEPSTEKTPFLISYTGSTEGQVYAEFIKEIYEELGFEVTITIAPVKRGLMLLNNNMVDADVIRLRSITETYKNIMLVEPPIAQGLMVLLCKKTMPCDESILQDQSVYIQSNEGNLKLFKEDEIKAQILVNEMVNNTLNMLRAEHIHYALYSLDSRLLEMLSSQFNYLKLKDVSGYHVINKKHAHLLPQIQQKITEKLPAFTERLDR